ncbi:MAG: hypothetical protein WCO03_00440 [bacterium]
MNLLNYKKNHFSQNGEDGVIEKIFELLGQTEPGICCEFGAWDGLHLSNVRTLIQKGWTAVMIEGEQERLNQLKVNYQDNPNVFPINEFVGTRENSLSSIFRRHQLEDYLDQLDFLSIDIDGLDYEIFETLDIKPKLICIEINAAHSPGQTMALDRELAKDNIGQPFSVFMRIAEKQGYELICYTGNAFFVRKDILAKHNLQTISTEEAYTNFLSNLNREEKEWLYLVNLGIVEPFFPYHNPLLTRKKLGLNIIKTSINFCKFTLRKKLKNR